MNLTKIHAYLALTAALTAFSPIHAATITWTGSGDGTNWLDPDNWDAGLPTSADTISLSGSTVEINGTGATFRTGLNGSGGTININSGGVLTQVDSDASALRRFSQINVNNGGTLIANDLVNIRTNLEVFSGGTLEGTSRMRGSFDFTINGTFRPGNSTVANPYEVNEGADLILGSNGVIELDLFANGDNEKFLLSVGSNSNASNLNLSTGTLNLILNSYTPSIGDSFDLWDITNINSSVTPGSGANIFLDGYNLDLTNWATDGIVTIASLASVPEPSIYAVILGLASLSFLFIRRRRIEINKL